MWLSGPELVEKMETDRTQRAFQQPVVLTLALLRKFYIFYVYVLYFIQFFVNICKVTTDTVRPIMVKCAELTSCTSS